MRRILLGVMGLLLLYGCRGNATSPAGSLSREQFIQTYIALREARTASTSMEDFQRRRDRILDERSVTSDQLRSFIRAHGRDLSYMHDLWEEIGRHMEEAAKAEQGATKADSSARGRPPPAGDSSPAAPDTGVPGRPGPTPTRSSTAASS